MREISDHIGESRPHNKVNNYPYWPWDLRAEDWIHPNAENEFYNLAVYMEKSNLVVAASTKLQFLLIFSVSFDGGWNTDIHEYLETVYDPFKLCEFDGIHTLVLWADAPYRSLVRVS